MQSYIFTCTIHDPGEYLAQTITENLKVLQHLYFTFFGVHEHILWFC